MKVAIIFSGLSTLVIRIAGGAAYFFWKIFPARMLLLDTHRLLNFEIFLDFISNQKFSIK